MSCNSAFIIFQLILYNEEIKSDILDILENMRWNVIFLEKSKLSKPFIMS